jgi:DNA (cytosine-5)-methyltransferase 1
MNHGSAFTGIGGIDLGFERAGIETSWQVEIEPRAQRVLMRHFPNVTLIDDIKKVDLERAGRVSVVSGGFPCQDVSMAGARRGLAGNRSGLYFAFMDVVEALSPTWVLIENVDGLLSANDGRDMAAVLGTLEELGYGWAYRSFDSRYFGVAQRRSRVFIVGCVGHSIRSAARVLFESEGLPWDSPKSGKARKASATGSRAGVEDGRGNLVFREPKTGPAIDARAVDVRNLRYQDEGVSGTLQTKDNGGWSLNYQNPVVVRMREGKEGGGKGALIAEDHALTLATGNDMTLFGSGHPRRLTPLECERLQGFPDNWTATDVLNRRVPDGDRIRLLGNAVCVNAAEWIGHRLKAAHEELVA